MMSDIYFILIFFLPELSTSDVNEIDADGVKIYNLMNELQTDVGAVQSGANDILKHIPSSELSRFEGKIYNILESEGR